MNIEASFNFRQQKDVRVLKFDQLNHVNRNFLDSFYSSYCNFFVIIIINIISGSDGSGIIALATELTVAVVVAIVVVAGVVVVVLVAVVQQ